MGWVDRKEGREGEGAAHLMARGDEGFDLVHLDAEVVRIDAHFNVHLLSSHRKSELVSCHRKWQSACVTLTAFDDSFTAFSFFF